VTERRRDNGALSVGAVDEELVSVVMPARNAEPYIEASIRSVQAQTWKRWELLCVDDGSTDGTAAIVARLASQDPRIRPIRREAPGGPGPARNTAIAAARGRWLAFLDSDDLWDPEKVETQLAFMRARGAALSNHGYRMMDAAGRAIGFEARARDTLSYRDLLRNTAVGALTVMIDRTRVANIAMPALPQHEDLVLWYALLRRGWTFEGLPQVLASYRILPRSASRNKLRSALHMWTVYREHERLGFFAAALAFVQYAWNAAWKHRGVRA
jgi:teichuronic acid biosynthesis glycosyltransferase TuaG